MKLNFVYDVCLYNNIIVAANGDISFGSNIIRPTFQFVGTLLPPSPPVRTITFDVNRDDILEGQEIGLLTIAPSTSFDGFLPRFQTVRIIINDANSEWIALWCCITCIFNGFLQRFQSVKIIITDSNS